MREWETRRASDGKGFCSVPPNNTIPPQIKIFASRTSGASDEQGRNKRLHVLEKKKNKIGGVTGNRDSEHLNFRKKDNTQYSETVVNTLIHIHLGKISLQVTPPNSSLHFSAMSLPGEVCDSSRDSTHFMCCCGKREKKLKIFECSWWKYSALHVRIKLLLNN